MILSLHQHLTKKISSRTRELPQVLAEALGFDWISFWSGVGAEIKSLTKNIIQTKPSEEELGQQVDTIVASQFRNNFNGQIDKEKLKQLSQTTSFSNSGN